jgi:hypothetical protein
MSATGAGATQQLGTRCEREQNRRIECEMSIQDATFLREWKLTGVGVHGGGDVQSLVTCA